MSDRLVALIADDEEALRSTLQRRLQQIWPELQLIQARNGIEALSQAAEYEPRIAFLDIRMPGLDGLEVARRLNGRCHLVFVTAYDEYAVNAFERDAVDYLLKPVTRERLGRTVERLRQRLRMDPPLLIGGLLDRLAEQLHGPTSVPLQWIRAGVRDEVKLVAVEEIRCFISADKYTRVVVSEGELLIRKSIKELEAELDPNHFWRVHRGSIVNLPFVERCYRDDEGRVRLEIAGLEECLFVSRSYAYRFKQM